MDPIVPLLGKALMVGLLLACVFMSGAFAIRKRKEKNTATALDKSLPWGVWSFIIGFCLNGLAYVAWA